jgi:uncharacterized DUF497 family protein
VLDLDRLVGFEWDAGNRGKNLKHDVSDSEAEQVFFSHPLLVLEDSRHSGREARYHALGVTQDDRRLHVTSTLRDTGSRIRVISARDMHRKERAIYDAKAKENP